MVTVLVRRGAKLETKWIDKEMLEKALTNAKKSEDEEEEQEEESENEEGADEEEEGEPICVRPEKGMRHLWPEEDDCIPVAEWLKKMEEDGEDGEDADGEAEAEEKQTGARPTVLRQKRRTTKSKVHRKTTALEETEDGAGDADDAAEGGDETEEGEEGEGEEEEEGFKTPMEKWYNDMVQKVYESYGDEEGGGEEGEEEEGAEEEGAGEAETPQYKIPPKAHECFGPPSFSCSVACYTDCLRQTSGGMTLHATGRGRQEMLSFLDADDALPIDSESVYTGYDEGFGEFTPLVVPGGNRDFFGINHQTSWAR